VFGIGLIKERVEEGEVDGVEDDEMEGREDAEGLMDGVKDGEMEGREDTEGLMDGAEEEVGINVMDGTAEGTPRLGSHGISILS